MDDRFDMPSPGQTLPPLDREALTRILDLGGDALRQQLIADFARLRDSIDGDDHARVARAAHELKGLAATVGATGVANLARALDTAAQTHPIAASASMVAPLQEQLDRVILALQDAALDAPTGRTGA